MTTEDWEQKAREAGWTPPEPEWMVQARLHGWTPPMYTPQHPPLPNPYWAPPFIVTC